eukprot:gene1302-1644_t
MLQPAVVLARAMAIKAFAPGSAIAGLRALSTAVRVEKDTMGSLEVPAD